MSEIRTEKEMIAVMQELHRVGKNTWGNSKIFPKLLFWNTTGEEGNIWFPTIYAKLSLLNTVSKKLYGGKMVKINREP